MPFAQLAPFRTPRRIAAAQTSQLFNNPPPTGGLNLRDPISEMNPTDAMVLDNFIPRQQGVELRKGWQVHTTPAEGVTKFKSLMSFNSTNALDKKIFAAANGDIYDVTTEPATLVASATGSTEDQWWSIEYSTTSGNYLLAVSPGAGYWTYDAVNGWVDRTALTTGLPTSVRTVSVWKRRIWFTLADSSDVYYMHDVDAIQGTADVFPMGSILRNGGSVSAIINWTIDAGFSVDDFLVVVGTEGDIGVWEGSDPTDPAAFKIKGTWYIGPVPKYGVYFTAFGGDVMILSQQGLIPMSRLVSGQFNEAAANTMPASKIQATLAPLINEMRNEPSWGVILVPSESVMIIRMPEYLGNYRQFVMNTITGAWCTFSNYDMTCATTLNGHLYYGTPDGGVARGLYGTTEGANIDGNLGVAIEGDVQCWFNPYNTPAQLKKFHMARPIFLSTTAPSVKLQLNTQYFLDNVVGSPAFAPDHIGVWDTSNWNLAYFAGGINTYQAWVGVNGLGYFGSLRMKVKGVPGTVFTSAHVMSELGGVM